MLSMMAGIRTACFVHFVCSSSRPAATAAAAASTAADHAHSSLKAAHMSLLNSGGLLRLLFARGSNSATASAAAFGTAELSQIAATASQCSPQKSSIDADAPSKPEASGRSSPPTGSGGIRQQTSTTAADGRRGFSSSTASSSGSTWNHNPHQLPAWTMPQLDIPHHEIEQGVPTVAVWLRRDCGTNYCTKLRRGGVTPCQVSSLPGNQALPLALDNKDAARLVRQYGRNGLQARVLRLDVYADQEAATTAKAGAAAAAAGEGEGDSGAATAASSSSSSSSGLLTSVRVLPKLVHIHSVTAEVENFNFMFCPQDRLVKVNVPVKLWNNDVSPGVKGGGWLHVVNRTIPVLAKGWAVQPFFELDMRNMRAKDVLRFRDVPMPPGCQLHVKDPLQPVVRCAVRVGGE